jgi:hypothetical protein
MVNFRISLLPCFPNRRGFLDLKDSGIQDLHSKLAFTGKFLVIPGW